VCGVCVRFSIEWLKQNTRVHVPEIATPGRLTEPNSSADPQTVRGHKAEAFSPSAPVSDVQRANRSHEHNHRHDHVRNPKASPSPPMARLRVAKYIFAHWLEGSFLPRCRFRLRRTGTSSWLELRHRSTHASQCGAAVSLSCVFVSKSLPSCRSWS
jgi:hypothetical protein